MSQKHLRIPFPSGGIYYFGLITQLLWYDFSFSSAKFDAYRDVNLNSFTLFS